MKLNWIGAALLVALSLGPAAIAHEELVGSYPADGSVVEAGVIELDLEFSNELLDLGSGAELVVQDQSKSFVPATCLLVSGSHAYSTVDLDQPGEYQVGWRVVSADGHPIEGSFRFTVENSAGYEALGIQEPCLIAQAAEEEPGVFSYWLLFGSLGLMATGLFFYLRPRKQPTGEQPEN
jgi:methionine-rich copper-binding protein CopC